MPRRGSVPFRTQTTFASGHIDNETTLTVNIIIAILVVLFNYVVLWEVDLAHVRLRRDVAAEPYTLDWIQVQVI